MVQFIVRRVLQSIPMLWMVVTLTFFVVHLLPGDPATLVLVQSGASSEAIAERRAMLGWDRPLLVQYGDYLTRVLRGDLGRSWISGDSVARLLAEQWPATFRLAIVAMVIAMSVGVSLGLVGALRRGTWLDRLSMSLALLGLSMPVAWSGLLAIWLLSLIPLPQAGGGPWPPSALLLPAMVLGLASTGPIARLTRHGVIEVLAQPYIMAATAKGLSRWYVLIRHAAPIALPPVLTMAALQFGFLLGGVAITEAMFARQGIGRLAVQAVMSHDLPVIQGIVLLAAALYTGATLCADVAQWLMDPRSRR